MTDIYRGMDRATLDRAYSPSSMVPSIDPFLARYAADSAMVRAGFAADRWASVAYGPGAAHSFDLFRPIEAPAPLVVFIHGGYWQALSKADASFPARALADAGIAYASLDYTLAPHARLDAIVEEARAALSRIWVSHAHLGIDRQRIVLSGHSAGAHLAAMLLATNWAARGLPDLRPAGAILIGGIYDLEPIRLSYVDEALHLDVAAVDRNSPLRMTPAVDCPLVVTWAEHDTDEFKRQSRALAMHWAGGGRAVTTFEQAGRNHFDCLFDWCEPQTRLFKEAERLLGA